MTYHSGAEMGMDDYMLDSQMMEGYDMFVPEGPFFSYIITYSGHGPYTEEMGNISAPHWEAAQAAVAQSGVESTPANLEEYTHAVAHAMETDQFIGELVAQLEADGRLEDTVLLFYTDHYGKYLTDKEFLYQLKGVSADSPELYRTPCFFYAKGQQPQTVEKYVAPVDLAPTIVNLFGLDTDTRYYMGDDMFGDQGGVVLFPDGGWYDGETYYTSDYQGKSPRRCGTPAPWPAAGRRPPSTPCGRTTSPGGRFPNKAKGTAAAVPFSMRLFPVPRLFTPGRRSTPGGRPPPGPGTSPQRPGRARRSQRPGPRGLGPLDAPFPAPPPGGCRRRPGAGRGGPSPRFCPWR